MEGVPVTPWDSEWWLGEESHLLYSRATVLGLGLSARYARQEANKERGQKGSPMLWVDLSWRHQEREPQGADGDIVEVMVTFSFGHRGHGDQEQVLQEW
jgi:hypothetical protein